MAAAIAVPLVVAFIASTIIGAVETSGEQKALNLQIDNAENQYAQDTLALDTSEAVKETELTTLTNDITEAESQLEYDVETMRLQKAIDVGSSRASAAARGIGSGGTAAAIEDYTKMLADRAITERTEQGNLQLSNLRTQQKGLQSLLDPGGYYDQQRTLLESDYNTNMDYLTEQTSAGAQGLSFLTNTLSTFIPFVGMIG